MTTSREMVLVGGVVSALRVRGSWTGETHIQKTAYIAKIKRDIPFESDFVLYKHGPYSFDLNKSLGHMLSRNLLVSHSNPGYGPSYGINAALWGALNSGLGGYYAKFQEAVEEIADRLARKNVSELEKIATAVFVSTEYAGSSMRERAAVISKIKPHIAQEAALESLAEADQI